MLSKRIAIRSSGMAGAMLALMFLASPLLAKRSDDTIEFKNGDRLVGKIKNLEKGMLYFENPNIFEPIHLNWSKIARLTSKDQYIITLTDGKRYIGLIQKDVGEAGAGESLLVSVNSTEIKVRQSDIVDLRPVEETFWNQLKGGVDAGFEFAQGNHQTTVTAHTDTSYLTTGYSIGGSYDALLSTQTSGPQTTRNDARLNYQKFFSRNWLIPVIAEWLQSSRQQLDLRTTVGTGVGRYLIRTNRTTLAVFGGAVLVRERFSPQTGRPTSDSHAEGLIGGRLSVFRFLRTQYETQVAFYPSFTESGRYRVVLNSDLLLTPTRKLYWKLGIYENFDSAPPDNTPRNDFGTSISLGWRF